MVKIFNFLTKHKGVAVTAFFSLASIAAQAQVSPSYTGYFQNRYLLNPAMAGMQNKMNIHAAHRNEQLGFDNAPTTQFLSADYKLSDVHAVGVNGIYDRANLLNSLDVKASYAFHAIINSDSKFSVGLSAGIRDQRLSSKIVYGEAGDPLVNSFNSKTTKFDADFGLAYTWKSLTVQASGSNLLTYFQNDEKDWVNKPMMFGAASYKIKLTDDAESVTIEPMAVCRVYKGTDVIYEGGANATFLGDKVNVMAMYQSTKNVVFGAGVSFLNNAAGLNIYYSTKPSEFAAYSDGSLQVGLAFHIK